MRIKALVDILNRMNINDVGAVDDEGYEPIDLPVRKYLTKKADRLINAIDGTGGIEYVEEVTIELLRRPATMEEIDRALANFEKLGITITNG